MKSKEAHVVRGDDGEIGLSFDKFDSRHYFFFGQKPPERFLLSFAPVEGAARVELNKETKSVAFFDATGKRPRIVYSAPTVKLSNNQTVALTLDWDPTASAIVVVIPEPTSPPLVLAFAVGLKYTELKGEKYKFVPPGRVATPTQGEAPAEKPSKEKTGRDSLKTSKEFDKDKDAVVAKPVAGHAHRGSFSGIKFHTFKLDRAWQADLYGGSGVTLTAIPPGGKIPKLTHHVLPGIDVNLNLDGSVDFGAGDWKFKLTPAFVPTPPVFHRGDGVLVLRGEDGELGLFSDKVASRHFFIIGKTPTSNRFGLKLSTVNGQTKVDFSPDKGYVAFLDSAEKYKLVYFAPRVITGTGKNVNPHIEWDEPSSLLYVALPDQNLPIVVGFQLGVKAAFPKFRSGNRSSGTFEALPELDEKGNPKTKPSFSGLPTFLTKSPNFKLVRPWQEALYGPADVTLTPISATSRQPIPALNGLEVGLSPGGEVDFGSPEWRVKLAPVNFALPGAKLNKGDGLQIVRSDVGEVGISYDATSLRHYFFFGKAPVAQKFSLKLTPLSGSAKVELHKEKGVITFLDSGKIKFAYTSPVVLLPSNKTLPLNIDWEGPSSSIVVLLPEISFPLVLAFGITGKIPDSKERSRDSSFPSFRFGAAGNIEVPASEGKEREVSVPTKKPTSTTDKAKQFGFSFSKPKISLPSFSLNFPKFKIGSSWKTTLYGRSGNLSPVPEGQVLRISYPSLKHFEVGLSPAGEVHFGSGDWKLSVAPVSFKITAPKLHQADGLQVLRGDDGEIGISFDETSSRHFFILGKAPSSTKFSIKLTQSGAQVDFNKERGYLALTKGPVALVYYAPVVLLPTNKTVTLPLEWDAHSTTLSVVLPDLAFPVIIAFGIGTKIPDAKEKPGFAFRAIKLSGDGESSSSSSSDDEDEPHVEHTKPVAKESFPVSYQKGVPSPLIADTLYNVSTSPLAVVPSGQSAQLTHPSLGLDLSLNHSGELEFASPTFKVKLTPNIVLTSPKLQKHEKLQVLRADDGEIGVSFGVEGPSRHFFILGKEPAGKRLSLTLGALTGGVKLKFDRHSIEISDDADKPQFVYLSPVAQYATKTVTLPLEWDAETSSIFVTLPDSATYPLLVAFGVSPKVIEGTARWGVVFPSLRGRVTRNGEVDDGPEESAASRKKISLPSFFSKFSPAKLIKWISTLYGPDIKADALVEPPLGETSLSSTIPSLNLSVSLNEDGEVEFSNPDWKGKFFPETTVRFGRLLSHEGLHLLRHRDGEIGVSFDKTSIRYFFLLNTPTPAFTLNFEQIEGATKLQFYEDRGILTFAEESGKVIVVFSSPLILSGEKTTSIPLAWNGSITIPIPPETKFPAVLTFGLSNVEPEPEIGLEAFFPALQISKEGVVSEEREEEEGQEEEEDVQHTETVITVPAFEKQAPSELGIELGKFGFSSRYPAFKLDAPWITALYGVDLNQPISCIPQGEAAVTYIPSLGDLKVSLNYQGEVTFQDEEWKLVLAPHSPFIKDATLIEREGLIALRNDVGELGISYDPKGSRFFVILGTPLPSPVLSLPFKIEPGTKVVHTKDKGLVSFQDKSGKPKLVVASPVGRTASNENFTFPLEWDSSSQVIKIALPHTDSTPFAYAFALYSSPPKTGIPAIPGIDAPVYEFSKTSPAQSPKTSPAQSPSPTSSARAKPNSPPPSSLSPSHTPSPPPSTSSPSPTPTANISVVSYDPQQQTTGPTASPSGGHRNDSSPSQSYRGPSTVTEGKFSVEAPLDDLPVPVAQPIKPIESIEPTIPITVKTPREPDLSSESETSSSSSDEEKQKGDKPKEEKKHRHPERHGSTANVPPEQRKAEKEKRKVEREQRRAQKQEEKAKKAESDRIAKDQAKAEKAEQAKRAQEQKKKEEEAKKKADQERRSKELAKLGPLPSASFEKGFRGALYGKVELDNFVHEQPATTLYSATTNLTFAITAHDGVLSIGPAQGDAWHVRVVPIGITWDSANAKLFKGSAFVSVRSTGVEIGAQVREDSSSQFFVLGSGGPITLRFETHGIGEIKHTEKDGETLFSDVNGTPLFIYSTPALHARSKSKKIHTTLTWNDHSKELRIEAQNYTESVGIVAAICTKCITLPPDDVLYSMPDGSFVVVHPKVNFYGRASKAGITYTSLTPEVDPWGITFALQGGKVHKAYAQSKCTVVLLRDSGIREYLAYVDRGGDYVGLHHTFHLHNPPSSYPLKITIGLKLEHIVEVAETTDSLITFSTKSGPVFAYGNVIVLDARGNSLASKIRLEDADSDRPKIVLEVLEEGEFPLVVG